MRERTKEAARRFGICERLDALEKDLLQIEGIPDVDFDVDNYDEIPQVIIVLHYALDFGDDYYMRRKDQLAKILRTLSRHDLHDSGDIIEDMGEHWYVVRNIGKTWPRRQRHAG